MTNDASAALTSQKYTSNPVRGFELWRMKQVREVVGLSDSMIYILIQRGEFPKQVTLTGRTRAWRAADIIDWCEARAKAGDAA
ncbi:AlpA family phage regulatory protein [Methylococcus sp. ANG]|uniref:helix-turn-helix transcriptional regulator n=1 Tax=Methylococcus sp. ANG TaxID=3231903 RepID=UPI00345741AD